MRRNIDRVAQLLTQFICDELLRRRKKFSFETVFSDPSKLQLMARAKRLGYKNYLYFISTNDPEINKDRVRIRVEQGGHDVPSDIIESRYHRSLGLLTQAVALSYHAFMFDNSSIESHMFAEYKNSGSKPYWWLGYDRKPRWFDEHYLAKLDPVKEPAMADALNRAAINWAIRS